MDCLRLLFICILIHLSHGNIIEVSSQKMLKKHLRTHVNVLIFFQETSRSGRDWVPVLREAAIEMEGKASILQIDCSADKKLCKRLKASPAPISLKHFRDGKFHKDYDRLKTKKSITRFLEDPTSDVPWDEDSTATHVTHVDSQKGLVRLLKKEPRPVLIMFYAPWCGYCKRMKPDFAAAAQELKDEAVLAGMDVDKPELVQIRQQFNITGFPTLYYIHGGKVLYKYGGENNKEAIIQWMRNPEPPKDPEPEKQWSDEEEAHDIHFLTTDSFSPFMQQHPSVLVMFYAPWCGHCKAMKPAFGEVATKLKAEGINGMLAAVDATKESALAEKFKVQGFPTVKYFKDGEFAFDFNERSTDKLLEFMKDPKEPPPPPPPEPQWSEQPSEVQHLTVETFHDFLRKKKHVLTMFYAPWCGHCKKAKPEFTRAAEALKDDRKVSFAAVDCTQHTEICTSEGVSGYPTFHHYIFGKKDPKGYPMGREEEDFVAFMSDPSNPKPVGQVKHWKAVPGFENVVLLDKENFQLTQSAHEALFVKFYAPWCGHCKAMKPAFAQLAGLVKEKKIPVAVGAVDATEDEQLAAKHGVSGYPTLLYITTDGAVEKYRGARSAEDMLAYIEEKQLPKDDSAAQPDQEQKMQAEEEERKRKEEEEKQEAERKKEEEERREKERLRMEEKRREDERMRKEDEKRREEERKRKEEEERREERKRKEEEKRREEERKRKEEEERREEERKRKEEEKRRQEERKRKEEEKRREQERKRKEEEKRREEERKRKEEEKRREERKREEEEKRREEEQKRKEEEKRREEERKRKEEEKRREEERKRKEEEKRREERKRKEDERREEERRRKEEEKRREERKRKEDERREEERKRKEEEKRREEQKRKEEEKRREEEKRKEEKRREEERKRKEEEKKREEERKKKEDEKRRVEERKRKEEKKRREEERKRKEEEKRREEEKRLKEEEKKRKEEEKKRKEEEKKRKKEEKKRKEEEKKRSDEKRREGERRKKQEDEKRHLEEKKRKEEKRQEEERRKERQEKKRQEGKKRSAEEQKREEQWLKHEEEKDEL